MSERASHNPALWISEAFKDFIGRLGLSTIETDALTEPEAAVTQPKPRRTRRTAQDEPLPKMPRITRGYGAGLTPLVYSERPAGASEAEIEDRALADAAMAANPRPGGKLPPLYEPRRKR